MRKRKRHVGNAAVLALAAGCMLPVGSSGRIREHSWTFQEMFDKSDLVLIATPGSSKNTDEKNVLLGDIKVVGVSTEFTPRLILKGPNEIHVIQLHYYRLENPNDELIADGPNLLDFARPAAAYLLFLVREKTGTYAPVEGQTDPADASVVPLRSLHD